MATTSLLLGPFEFQDFELPATISWGGRQALTVHRLPGGVRVIDVMGRDNAPISWSGIFTGDDATLRAHALDLMRAQGLAWPLVWNNFFYSVIISGFAAEYQRSNWVPYRITCTVVLDAASSLILAAADPALSIAADQATAALYSAGGATTAADLFSSGPTDLASAVPLSGSAAQQATAAGYNARAVVNQNLRAAI